MVELLAVIAIMSVLIAILLPVLHAAREAANTTKCLSNLHQIGLAIQMYAQDYHGYLLAGDHWGILDGSPDRGPGNWADVLAEGKYFAAPRGTDGAKGPPFDPSILLCPNGLTEYARGQIEFPLSQKDARGALAIARLDDFTGAGLATSYAFNGAFWGFGLFPFRMIPDSSAGTADYRLNRLASLRNPTQMPLLFDGLWCFNLNANSINARHNNRTRTNLLMADGHCETAITNTLPTNDWFMR